MRCIIRMCDGYPMMEPQPPHNGSLAANLRRSMCELHYWVVVWHAWVFFGRTLPPSLFPADQMTAIEQEYERLNRLREGGWTIDYETSNPSQYELDCEAAGLPLTP